MRIHELAVITTDPQTLALIDYINDETDVMPEEA